MNRTVVTLLTAAIALHSATAMAADPVVKCKASKNKIAGAYYSCREKAEAKAISKGVAPDYSKCTAKFNDKWDDAESKGGCPDTVTTAGMRAFISDQASDTAAIIAGTMGLAACDAPFTCPEPSDGSHQTICGQLYDLDDGSKFQAEDAVGATCTPSVDGPCSLAIVAYDAVAFGTDPLGATPLATGSVSIDDCGRYRVSDIVLPSGPFIALQIDDSVGANAGPTGTTNTVSVVTPKQGGEATSGFDGWVAAKATTDLWESSGGPTVAGGLYIPIFFEAMSTTNRDLQDGVTITASGSPVPARDHYFVETEPARHTIDAGESATGVNGTVLVTGASVAESVAYSGTGGTLSASCVWESHAGASLSNILWVQEFRPKDAVAQTCDR